MLDLKEIRRELGEIALKESDSLDYTVREIVEKYAIKHFGRLPYLNSFVDWDDLIKENPNLPKNMAYEDEEDYDEDDATEEKVRERNYKIDTEKSLEKLLERYPETAVLYMRPGRLSNSILFHDDFIYKGGVFYMDKKGLPDEMKACIVEKSETPKIRWILRTSQGHIQNKYMEISPKGEMENNYNDDFYPVNAKIEELIHKDESSIMILHGKPGTGKTSYIRDLITKNSDINFYWIDATMFNYIDSAEFIEFIATCKNAVFILEDSESLLVSREENRNPAMQSLLSISDGMLGDSLKLKFICTFNTDLQNIDKAILRKGRTKIKYEFKDLKKDKVKEIFKKLGMDENLVTKDMPLCDIYNFLEDNGVKQTINKIGF